MQSHRYVLSSRSHYWNYICTTNSIIIIIIIIIIIMFLQPFARLCGLVNRVPGYRSRGPRFDSRRFQIFWEVDGLERGPLSLVSTIEELLGRNSSGSGLENQDYGRRGSVALTTRYLSIRKIWH
jgi:hypothetical protein